MRLHTFQTFNRFLRGFGGRTLAASVIALTFPSFVEFGHYASAMEVDRRHTDEIKAIAKRLNIDPEFLLHPGPKKPSVFVGMLASLEGKLSLFNLLGATTAVKPLAATNIPNAIQDVKEHYGLVAADTALAKIASLVQISLASSAFIGKNRGQIRAQVESVLRLLSKDFLPALKPGLPGVANGRDGQIRNAVTQLRSNVKAILNAPNATADVNLEATLAQVRAAVSSTLSVRAAKPRWTKDSFPLKDSSKTATVQSIVTPYPGAAPASSAVTPAIRPLSTTSALAASAPAPEVVALAQNLATSAKIFAFVHDKVGFTAYSGVAKGSLGTLKELKGNDWDQAILLSDLLTAVGYQTQFETGRVTIPIAQAMNLVGTEDPLQAGNLLATAGYDALVLTAANTPVAVQLTHAWVRAYIPYTQNRGATTGTADTWVRMDPSFKRYQYTAGIPIVGKVNWSEDEYIQTAAVGTGLIPSPTDSYGNKVWAYLRAQNIVCQNLSQVGKAGTVIQENFPYVPATLTVRIEGATTILAAPPADQIQSVALSLSDATGARLLTYAPNLSDLWGKKLSLTFAPATADDAAIINTYGGIFNTPAYLVNLKPVFSLDDQPVAQGTATPAGAALDLGLSFTQPNVPVDTTHHDLVAGETHSEIFDAGTPPDSLLLA
ncbi:MAG: transglutaminase domain-containing protein, partial [Thermoanaerobaculia bacterium]